MTLRNLAGNVLHYGVTVYGVTVGLLPALLLAAARRSHGRGGGPALMWASREGEGTMKLVPDAEARYGVQDYRPRPPIAGVQLLPLRRFHDDAGSMTELVRLVPGGGAIEGLPGFSAAQVNYSSLEPGAIKAFHVHRRQSDLWFVPPEDRVLLVLVDVREGSPTTGQRMRLLLGDGSPMLVLVPPGVAHGCRNVGSSTARIVYLTDQHFRPEPDLTDEGRLPWDFAGAEIWEPARE